MHNSPKPGLRIGLMGGTFNPIHLGHLRAAEEIAEQFRLDGVCFMPAAQPPHKSPEPLADYSHRLEMLKQAVAERPGFFVSDLESRLPYPSYTINTVKAFTEESGADNIFFLVGLDSFMTIAQWHKWRELLALIPFIVFARAGMSRPFETMREMLTRDVDPETSWNPRGDYFTVPGCRPLFFQAGGRLKISSTDLRQRLESGASVRYLVAEPVRRYIESHGLYRPPASEHI